MGSEVDVYIHKGYSSRDVMRPFITLEGEAMDALEFYKSIFPNFSIDSIKYHQEPYENLIMLAKFVIDEQEVLISDSYVNHDWGITPGISFFINANSEKELRNLETKLSENGKVYMPAGNYGFSKYFSWVEDRFGINWQINFD